MREAPSVALIGDLIGDGASVQRLRPGGTRGGEKDCLRTRNTLLIVDTALDALEGADALAIVTEWQEFRSPDFAAIKAKLKTPAIFDGRNLYDPPALEGAGDRVLPDRQEASEGARIHRRRGVLVVGDVMLDRYWYRRRLAHLARGAGAGAAVPRGGVSARRRSQRRGELRRARRAHAAALGGRPRRAPASGWRSCSRQSASTASLHRDARVHTTQKLRVIARRQQLLRIDMEKAPSTEVLASKLADFRARARATATWCCSPTTARAASSTSPS